MSGARAPRGSLARVQIEALLDGLADMRARPGRTLLQMAGVLLGVASIVACLTIVDANRTQSLKFFEKMGGLRKILVRNQPPRTVDPSARELAATGLTMADVRLLLAEGTTFDIVDPVSGSDILVRRGSFQRTEWVQGVTSSFPSVYEVSAAEGRFITEHDVATAARVVVLGDTAARRIFGGETAVGKSVDIGGQGFQVVGVLRRREHRFGGGSGGNALEWMNRYVLIPITTMTGRIKGDPLGRLDYMNVMALTAADADRAAAETERLLLKAHGGVRDFRIHNRRERMQQMQDQMMAFNVTFVVAAVVSLLVGGVVITNILLASFKTRVREVGVRKALGASGREIFIQFLVESVAVTAVAGVLGLALGKAFSIGVASLTGAASDVSARTVLIALAVAVITGVVFGFYPALRAARLEPVEALRYE